MRTLIIVIVCLFTISCSVSNEKKAQKLIGEKLKETLHDYSSYESVKFGTLDTVYTSILEDTAYTSFEDKLSSYTRLAESALSEADMYSEMSGSYYGKKFDLAMKTSLSYQDSIKLLKPIIDSLEKFFVPKQAGWRMTHTFRSNNALGAKTIGTLLYFFDMDLTKITEYNEVNESTSEK